LVGQVSILWTGLGIYANDPLYFGDTFTYGNKNSNAIANAGSNWFFGYLQQAAIYQYTNKNFNLEFDYVPGDGAQGTGSAKGAGGSAKLGDFQLSAAIMRRMRWMEVPFVKIMWSVVPGK